MADFDNKNTFTLFKNNRKTEPNHADWNGTVNIDGVEYWLNGWTRTPKNGGDKFLSGPIKKKESKNGSAPAPKQMQSAGLDDDLPF